ncbi:MAG TPA: hypothetical protein VKR06_34625 [Ktedonosporobacter sp.]|nr:hypothetical protein [Ktedonosporobacter sp.]
MLVSSPFQTLMQQRPSAGFIPDLKIYEEVRQEVAHWEYQTLTIDTNERALPDDERLNALGREGWLLIAVLPERPTGDVSLVHYYFIRQLVK